MRLPHLTTLRRFQDDALTLFADAGAPEDGVLEVDFGLRRAFVTTSADTCKRALTDDAFAKGNTPYGPFGTFTGFGVLQALVGPTLPTLDGEEGQSRRHLLHQVYRQVPARVNALSPSSSAERFPVGSEVDIHPTISALVFERFAHLVFGQPYAHHSDVVVDAVCRATTAIDRLSRSFIPHAHHVTAEGRELKRCRRALLDVAQHIVDDVTPHIDDDGAPPIAALVGAGLPADLLVDEVLTEIVAGVETTTSSCCWTLHALAHAPDWQRRIRAGDDVALERSVKEAMRLYPSFWTMIRVAQTSTTLGEHGLDRGDVVFVCPYLLHRNAHHWPSPMSFLPDRFADRRRQPGDYMPFGYGGRACLGGRLADLIVREVVRDVVRHFNLAPGPEDAVVDPLIVCLKSKTGFHFDVARLA